MDSRCFSLPSSNGFGRQARRIGEAVAAMGGSDPVPTPVATPAAGAAATVAAAMEAVEAVMAAAIDTTIELSIH